MKKVNAEHAMENLRGVPSGWRVIALAKPNENDTSWVVACERVPKEEMNMNYTTWTFVPRTDAGDGSTCVHGHYFNDRARVLKDFVERLERRVE